MSKHTPGPWEIVADDERPMRIVDSVGRVSVVDMPDWQEEFENEEFANARLISAAPEMLAALRECWATLCNLKHHNVRADIERAEAAIAKAEGEA